MGTACSVSQATRYAVNWSSNAALEITLVVELVARARRLLYTQFLPNLCGSNLANHSSDLLLDLCHCGDCHSLRGLVVYLPPAAADRRERLFARSPKGGHRRTRSLGRAAHPCSVSGRSRRGPGLRNGAGPSLANGSAPPRRSWPAFGDPWTCNHPHRQGISR